MVNEFSRAAILRVGKKSGKQFNRILANSSLVGDPAWFDRDQFPWMKTLEDSWEIVRREAEGILEARDLLPAIHEISPDHDRLSNDGTWKAFFFYGYGSRFDRSCAHCLETAKLLDSVPNLSSAFLSILAPGSHLPPHRGPTKAIITW
ncbi:MAG: aspartyl/asparaginyl beta-hydroxylase domain-containing protein, partial [Myxococcota bacterium]